MHSGLLLQAINKGAALDKEEIKPADAKLDKGKKTNQNKTSNMALLYTSGFATRITLFPKSVFINFLKMKLCKFQ